MKNNLKRFYDYTTKEAHTVINEYFEPLKKYPKTFLLGALIVGSAGVYCQTTLDHSENTQTQKNQLEKTLTD